MIARPKSLQRIELVKLGVVSGLLALATVPQTLEAQSFPAMKLIVENLPGDAKACGVDRFSIEAAMRSAARYNRITLNDEAPYALYVNVNVAEGSTLCTAAVDVEIYGYQFAEFGDEMKFAKTMFCQDGGAGSINKNRTSTYLLDYLKQSLDRCLSKID